jgi:hypothetical protein
MDIDELIEKPYWIVDILPKQVAKNSNGQYFAIEQYYLSEPQSLELRKKYANLFLKLNCYFDILVLDDFAEDSECGKLNPDPKSLVNCFVGEHAKNSVRLLIRNENTLIVSNQDDTYMTVYNPSERVLALISTLAAAEGLYVWKP